MRTIHTTPALIEAMAERSGRPLELTHDAAFLTVGQTTWYAILPTVGR